MDDETTKSEPIERKGQRPIPTRDAVAAYRALLKRDCGHPSEVPPPLSRVQQTLATRIYPYTKGPETTNESLSYGERVRELNRAGTPRLEREPQMSRMTRSGRAVEAQIEFATSPGEKSPAASSTDVTQDANALAPAEAE